MQVPSRVEYERATSVGHALSLLSRPETRVLAGGHSLIPMMKLRLAQPEVLVDINDLAELAYIKLVGGQLCIGALTRHADLLDSTEAGELFPIFHDAERVVADPVVRQWGTVGGSLCQADPSEDLSAVFAAAHAAAVIRGPDGMRKVPVREFHLGPYQTVVGQGELLAEVRVPVHPGTGSAYQKVARRVGDWSIAAVGAVLRMDGDRIVQAGLGLTAVGAEHFVAAEAEEFLRGKTERAFEQAAAMADGRAVRTVEDLERDGALDPVQQGFIECHGLQCGFCTPGMLMTARWLLDRNPDPGEPEIREAISGQVCRCTGYENIVRSIRWAAAFPGGTTLPALPPAAGPNPPAEHPA